jgi:hypothetical protein
VVFIPARCTDVLQECDTVVNNPFKSGLMVAFRDFLQKYLDSYKGDKNQWTIKLTMGKLNYNPVGRGRNECDQNRCFL